MLELAAQLGTTAAGLGRSMTERELDEWRVWARRRMLPQRRIELYLAQIAMYVVRTMGGRPDVTLDEFLFDPQDEEPADTSDDELDPMDVAAFFGAELRSRSTSE